MRGSFERGLSVGAVHGWGFGSGGLDGADAAGQFGGDSFGGGAWGGGSSSIDTEKNPELAFAKREVDRRSFEKSRSASEQKGVHDRAKANVAIGLLSIANPLAGLLGWLGAQAYGLTKSSTAASLNEKAQAKGFLSGPQKTAYESITSAGLSLAPFLGLPAKAATFGKNALDMAIAARTAPEGTIGAQTSQGSSGGGTETLGAWTGTKAVEKVLKRANVSATKAQIQTLTNDYNSRHQVVNVRKSRPLSTRPERYAYLTGGSK